MAKDDIPPIRIGEDGIEIDVKKGKWPFLRMIRQPDGRLFILLDCNDKHMIAGPAENIAAVVVSAKKARVIEEFLERTSV